MIVIVVVVVVVVLVLLVLLCFLHTAAPRRLCLPELELILNLLALPGLVSLEQGIRAQFKFQTLQVSVIFYIYSRRERFVVLVVSGLVQRQFWWF